MTSLRLLIFSSLLLFVSFFPSYCIVFCFPTLSTQKYERSGLSNFEHQKESIVHVCDPFVFTSDFDTNIIIHQKKNLNQHQKSSLIITSVHHFFSDSIF